MKYVKSFAGYVFLTVCIACVPVMGEVVSWTATMPNPALPDAGLEVISPAIDSVIYEATPEVGMYSNGVRIQYDGMWYVSWHCHANYESGAGQRILYSVSADGINWSVPAIGIDSITPMADPPATGVLLNARKVEAVAGRAYLIASAYEITDYNDNVPQKTYLGLMARLLDSGQVVGPAFWMRDDAPTGYGSIPTWLELDPNELPYAEADTKKINGESSDLYHYKAQYDITSNDGSGLIEHTFYTAPDGSQVSLSRTTGAALSLYAAYRNTPQSAWSTASASAIPDSHSLNEALVLPDGSVVLVGNNLPQENLRDPLVLSHSVDGYNFSRAWAIRSDAPALKQSLAGDRKTPGFQYPDIIQVDDYIWISYSIGKEDVAVTRIPIEEVMPGQADVNGDGEVDLFDYADMADAYLQTAP